MKENGEKVEVFDFKGGQGSKADVCVGRDEADP